MSTADVLTENRPENTRKMLRYAGWSLLAILVAYLFLAPARTGLVSDPQRLAVEEPQVPAATVAAAAQPADPNIFTAESMGETWPFNGISRATVECNGKYAVLIADNGTTYALDPAANMAARSGKEDFIRIDAIRRRTSTTSRTMMSLDPLLARASALCGK